jgi:thioredoxin-like negative regulator of GroEL
MRLALLAVSWLLLNDPSSPLQEANALLKAGRHEEAIKAFKQVASRDKQCGACYLGMAEAQAALQRDREVVENCDRALERGLPLAADRARARNIKGVALTRMAQGKADKAKLAEAELRLAWTENPENPSPLFNLGVLLLSQKRDEEGIAQLKAFLEKVPEGQAADAARRFIENPRRARQRFAPAFSAVLADGQPISLDGLKGKVVVLDFWATWCGPCRDAIPELKDLIRKHGEKPFVLLSISADEDEAAWRAFMKKNGMSWAHCIDSGGKLTRLFGVNAFPTYIVLDGEGAIREEIQGTDPQQSVAFRLKKTLESMPELASR